LFCGVLLDPYHKEASVGHLDYLTGKELRELKAMRRSVLLRAVQIRADAALNRVGSSNR
jgi:hypothetical protein